MDQIGRRPLIIMSEFVMGVTLCCLGFLHLFSQHHGNFSSFTGLSTFVLIIYEIFYSLGMGPLPWLLLGELVSSKRPGISLAIITSFYRGLGFLELYFFHSVSNLMGGVGWVYLGFAGCCFVGGILCYLIIPDTTRLRLEEIKEKV